MHAKQEGRAGEARAMLHAGFTLLEALLSTIVLGLMASVLAALYFAGLQNIAVQGERAQLDSALRSALETAIGEDFALVADATTVITLDGENFTLVQSVVNADLDGDSDPEDTAKTVTVSITERPGLTLSTLLVDHEDRVGKI